MPWSWPTRRSGIAPVGRGSVTPSPRFDRSPRRADRRPARRPIVAGRPETSSAVEPCGPEGGEVDPFIGPLVTRLEQHAHHPTGQGHQIRVGRRTPSHQEPLRPRGPGVEGRPDPHDRRLTTIARHRSRCARGRSEAASPAAGPVRSPARRAPGRVVDGRDPVVPPRNRRSRPCRARAGRRASEEGRRRPASQARGPGCGRFGAAMRGAAAPRSAAVRPIAGLGWADHGQWHRRARRRQERIGKDTR